MTRIAPLPLYVIQASRDTSVTTKEARSLFNLAGEPKCFRLVEADDHKFSGGQRAFFQALYEGLQWTK